MIAKKIHDIANSIGNPELADKIIKECNNGDAFLFSFNDCFVVLKVRTIDECLCIQIECAYSERKNGFMFGYSFVSARAAEIGAKYITFSTANKALEKMAANRSGVFTVQLEMVKRYVNRYPTANYVEVSAADPVPVLLYRNGNGLS